MRVTTKNWVPIGEAIDIILKCKGFEISWVELSLVFITLLNYKYYILFNIMKQWKNYSVDWLIDWLKGFPKMLVDWLIDWSIGIN